MQARVLANEGVAPPPLLCERSVLLLDESARLALERPAPKSDHATKSHTPERSCTSVFGLSYRRSALELQGSKSDWWDSHPRPLVPRTSALLLRHNPQSIPGVGLAPTSLRVHNPAPRLLRLSWRIGSGGNAPPFPLYQSGVLDFSTTSRGQSGLRESHPRLEIGTLTFYC